MGKTNGAPKAKPHELEARACLVELTEAERVQRGNEMAECEVAIEALKVERSELGRQIRTQEKRRNELGHALEKGVEERELPCTWEPDYPKNVFRLKRPDTGEVIDTRPMTADDRTGELFSTHDDGPLEPPPRTPKKRGRPKKSAPVAAA